MSSWPWWGDLLLIFLLLTLVFGTWERKDG